MLGLINIKLTIESAQAIADNMKKLKTLELFESESDEHAVQLTDEMALIIARGLPQLTFFSLSTHLLNIDNRGRSEETMRSLKELLPAVDFD